MDGNSQLISILKKLKIHLYQLKFVNDGTQNAEQFNDVWLTMLEKKSNLWLKKMENPVYMFSTTQTLGSHSKALFLSLCDYLCSRTSAML